LFSRRKDILQRKDKRSYLKRWTSSLKLVFIREVMQLKWLTNVFIVKKANGKWWMYIDFFDFNKACPKNSFPQPKINRLIEFMVKFEFLRFLDVNWDYQ
jgi:hypothetical protein